MLEVIAGAAVGIAALALVLEPLLRRTPAPSRDPGDDEPVPLEETGSPKVRALLALKEIEFDRATGKLSDEDYERLKTQYEAEAIAAMRAEEAGAAPADAPRGTSPVPSAADAAEALIREVRTGPPSCPSHGPRPEGDAVFCSECGRALAVA